MPTLESAAIAVSLDEPALSLAEVDVMSQVAGHGMRRVRRIRVVRNDRIAVFEQDLGPSRWFASDPVYLAGGVVVRTNGEATPLPELIPERDVHRIESLHTVGELLDMAEAFRCRPARSRQMEPQDLVAGYRRLVESAGVRGR